MWLLYQFPLCPFSRKVRLLLGEKGIGYDLVRESPWAMRDEFLDLNPAGTTPVMADHDKGLTLIDSQAICEYFEETVEKVPLISGTAAGRAEVRRLTAFFDQNFYGDVVGPLLHERMKKRLIERAPPEARILREAMKRANVHMDYMDGWVVGKKPLLPKERHSGDSSSFNGRERKNICYEVQRRIHGWKWDQCVVNPIRCRALDALPRWF